MDKFETLISLSEEKKQHNKLTAEKSHEVLDFIIDVLKSAGYTNNRLPRRYETSPTSPHTIKLFKRKRFSYDDCDFYYDKTRGSISFSQMNIFLKDIKTGWLDELIVMMQKDLQRSKETLSLVENVKETEFPKIKKYFTAMKMK